MIGIQNADGTVAWLLSQGKDGTATARISPVRHGQTRVRVPVCLRSSLGDVKILGQLRFSIRMEGMLERPELPLRLVLENQRKLNLSVQVNDRWMVKKLTIPRSNRGSTQRFDESSRMFARILLVVGGLCYAAAGILVLFPGLRG